MRYGSLTAFSPSPQETPSSGHSHWPIAAPTGTISPFKVGFNPPSPSMGGQPILRETVQIQTEELFASMSTQWAKETGVHSSITIRKKHAAYQGIVNLGWNAVPLLLKALRDMPDFWFPMLRDITHENPVQPEDRGDFKKMTDAWLGWGRAKGLCS